MMQTEELLRGLMESSAVVGGGGLKNMGAYDSSKLSHETVYEEEKERGRDGSCYVVYSG